MKNRKLIISTIAAIVIVLTVVLVIALVPKGHDEKKLSVTVAQQLIDDQMKSAFINSDASSYELNKLKTSAKISVLSISVHGNTATANCQIQSIDIGGALSELLNSLGDQTITQEVYAQKVKSAVDAAKKTEKLVELTFTLDAGDSWILDEIPYEVYDSYLGGYLTYAQEVITKMGGELYE